MEGDEDDVRRHGLELPHNGYQILSWGIFGSDIIFYFAIYMNVLAEPAKVIFAICKFNEKLFEISVFSFSIFLKISSSLCLFASTICLIHVLIIISKNLSE